MKMRFIDSHAHIYLPDLETDFDKLLLDASESNVHTILMPAIDSSTHQHMIETEKNNNNCYSMMGLHPCSVKDNYLQELNIVEDYFKCRKFIAVGEIGLDFYWDKTFTDQQYEVFHSQVKLALEKHLPIAIHSRNSINECIDVVSQYPGLTGVFHCFSGNIEQAEKIIDMQFMLGIGGVVTYKNAGLDKVIQHTGLSNVILETDAPYLAPVPFRGKRNEPAYIKLIAEKISNLLDISIEDVAQQTTQNTERLFSLKLNDKS